jgi:hypothetical protein
LHLQQTDYIKDNLARSTAFVRDVDEYHDPRALGLAITAARYGSIEWERALCGLRSTLLPPVSLAVLHKLYYPSTNHLPQPIPAGLFAASSALI